MKSKLLRQFVGFALACWLAGVAAAFADSGSTVERVLKKDGKMWTVQNGQTREMQEETILPGDIKVMTNGTFRVAGGKVRSFQEGQSLSSDGWLAGTDGSVAPVVDHVFMHNGRAAAFNDGERTFLTQAITLGNQTVIEPGGMIRTPDGRSFRLLDGQMYKMDGSPIATRDTISLQNGKVMVQKDGSIFPVPPGRSLMMNDGTKAFGDGTVVKNDGTRITLAEGQVLVVSGVVTRR